MRFTLLRLFVAAALLANLAYAAWQTGALAPLGLAPATQRDPARLQQQVRPDTLRVLTPAGAASAVAATASAAAVGPSLPTADVPAVSGPLTAASGAGLPQAAAGGDNVLACLDIGPLEAGSVLDGAERALAAVLPARAWAREQRPVPAQYAVFVGPILSRDAARARREELVKLKISFDAIELPDGRAGGKQGGYSLGRHDSEAAAQAALDAFRERGLRNARVVLAREGGATRTWLRMEQLTAAQAAAVQALPAAPFGGQKAAECVVGSVMSVVPR